MGVAVFQWNFYVWTVKREFHVIDTCREMLFWLFSLSLFSHVKTIIGSWAVRAWACDFVTVYVSLGDGALAKGPQNL